MRLVTVVAVFLFRRRHGRQKKSAAVGGVDPLLAGTDAGLLRGHDARLPPQCVHRSSENPCYVADRLGPPQTESTWRACSLLAEGTPRALQRNAGFSDD